MMPLVEVILPADVTLSPILVAPVPLPVATKVIFPEFVDTVVEVPVTEIPLLEESPAVDAVPVKEIEPIPVLVRSAEEAIVIPSLIPGTGLKVPFKLILPLTELTLVPLPETKIPELALVPLPAAPTSEMLTLFVATIVAWESMEIPELFWVLPLP
jgi:hypothetical protein